jgi:hypothetical protein
MINIFFPIQWIIIFVFYECTFGSLHVTIKLYTRKPTSLEKGQARFEKNAFGKPVCREQVVGGFGVFICKKYVKLWKEILKTTQ